MRPEWPGQSAPRPEIEGRDPLGPATDLLRRPTPWEIMKSSPLSLRERVRVRAARSVSLTRIMSLQIDGTKHQDAPIIAGGGGCHWAEQAWWVRGRMVPGMRFRIQTMMIAVAASAVAMGVIAWASKIKPEMDGSILLSFAILYFVSSFVRGWLTHEGEANQWNRNTLRDQSSSGGRGLSPN